MAYLGYNDILVNIDAVNLNAMCQDFDGNASLSDPASSQLLQSVCQQASDQVDGYIASIYQVPFTGNIPATVKEAAIIFACESLYTRRMTPDEKNPFKARATTMRQRLQMIGSGQLPLDSSFNRDVEPVIYAKVYNKANTSIM